MTRILNHLSTLRIAGARTEVDKESGLEVLHVDNSHALVQAAGYLKYTQALEHKKGVFFRGQTKLYSSLTPSLLRGVNDGPPNVKRRARLNDFLANIDAEKRVLRNVNPGCREALLQHYGIRTTWIDVVDNVWIALWFACHEALTKGWPEQYLHFEKRIPGVKAQYGGWPTSAADHKSTKVESDGCPTSRDFRDVGPVHEHLCLNHGGKICSSSGSHVCPNAGKHGAPTSLSFILRFES